MQIGRLTWRTSPGNFSHPRRQAEGKSRLYACGVFSAK
ncbi:hypothetical protein ACFW04_000414 [Cataglyphis niger]